MPDDVVKDLGLLTLGTRFRRIGERLQADTQHILDAAGVNLQAGQCPILAALDRGDGLTVGEVAQAVGVSQPGVTRTLSQLAEAGFVTMKPSPDDQRRRVVALSEEGRAVMARCDEIVWPRIRGAVADLCAGFDDALLASLSAIEDGLAEKTLSERSCEKDF